ncbi:MAG: hypothetical protein K0S44_2545 [Bacteroidetes bacterium]|nr:hypothetical protein [Bacteroidota bacterium]
MAGRVVLNESVQENHAIYEACFALGVYLITLSRDHNRIVTKIFVQWRNAAGCGNHIPFLVLFEWSFRLLFF